MEIIAIPLIYIFADDFCYQFLLHNEEKAGGGMSDADYSDCRKCGPWLYADYQLSSTLPI